MRTELEKSKGTGWNVRRELSTPELSLFLKKCQSGRTLFSKKLQLGLTLF